jgi:hypothetical protein
MKKTSSYLFIFFAALPFFSCKEPLKSELLQGKWVYVKIEELNHSADSVSMLQVEIQHPTIEFRKNGELEMIWGGELLSSGTYVIDGEDVQFTEQLPGGKKRTFPFHISKLDDKQIVFETTGRNGARVTAKRER